MAPSVSRLAGCSLALVLQSTSAVRTFSDSLVLAADDVALADESIFSTDGPICGGRAIRDFLTAPKSNTEVRNIPWSQVFAIADEYVKSENKVIGDLEAEVARLTREIPEREKAEKPRAMSTEQIGTAVTAAVGAENAFVDVNTAKESRCGAVRLAGGKRPPRSSVATGAAVAAFTKTIREQLSAGQLSVTSAAFRAACNQLLGFDPNVEPSNCGELCQQLADVAQQASDQFAGTAALNGRTADQLRQQLEETKAKLRFAQSEVDGCRQAKSDLDMFRGQLEGLQGNIKDSHGKLMGARDALLDAQYELEDTQVVLDGQANAAQAAASVLQGAGAKAAAAQGKFQEAQTKVGGLATSMQQASNDLKAAQQELKKTQDANDVLAQLKSSVSQTLLKMVLFFDDAVRKPLRDLGLSEKVDVDGLFPKNLGGLASSAEARASIQALGNFCTSKQTRDALAAVAKPGLDVPALCAIGDAAAIGTEVDGAVQARVDALKNSLRTVQSWLDPYKGQATVDRQTVERDIKAGEPVGLREVISTFGQTAFYSNYLKEWKVRGKVIGIYSTIATQLTQAQAAHETVTTKLAGVVSELKEAEKAQSAAKDALAAAVQEKQVAEGKQQEAQKLLDETTKTVETINNRIRELEAAVAAAQKRWEAAQEALVKAHKDATSLIELLEALEQ